jgi:MtN3 and saliva related transmembrane protein
MTTTLLAIAASSWGIAMALAPTLQIRHMIALRSSAGISIPYLAVLLFGFALWFAYGVALHNWALIVPNTVAFVVGATTIGVARHYRRASHDALSADRSSDRTAETTARTTSRTTGTALSSGRRPRP